MFQRFFRYVTDSTLRTFVGICVLNLIVFVGFQIANAAPLTSYNVHSECQFRLDVNVTPTQTTGIKLTPCLKNGGEVNLITTSGGILRLRRGLGSSFFEDIHYRTATVASDGVATLVNVTRNVCTSITNRIQSCGDGQQFYAGDIAELTVHHFLLNQKLDKDRMNILTESGMITGTSTGNALIRLNSVTTTQRNNFTNVGNGDMFYNSTLGVIQARIGSAWETLSVGGTVNASTTTAGKVQEATVAQQRNNTGSGSEARLFLNPSNLIRRSRGRSNSGAIVMANSGGYIDVEAGGTGSGSYASSGVLLTNGTKAFNRVAPGSNGNVLKSNGEEWVSGAAPASASLSGTIITIANSANAGVSSASEVTFNQTGAIKAGSTTAGTVYEWSLSGTGTATGTPTGTLTMTFNQAQDICSITDSSLGATYNWSMRGQVTFRTVGASAVGSWWCVSRLEGTDNHQYGNVLSAIDSTARIDMEPTVQFGASNSGNAMSHNQFNVFKITRDG